MLNIKKAGRAKCDMLFM